MDIVGVIATFAPGSTIRSGRLGNLIVFNGFATRVVGATPGAPFRHVFHNGTAPQGLVSLSDRNDSTVRETFRFGTMCAVLERGSVVIAFGAPPVDGGAGPGISPPSRIDKRCEGFNAQRRKMELAGF
jgi:hypothetical protein